MNKLTDLKKQTGCAYETRECLLGANCEDCPYFRAINEKLAHYEDLEEQELLIELSCKVGDTVWLLNLDKIEECVVDSFHIYDMRDIYVTLTTIKYNDKEEYWYEEDIDKSCTRFGIDTFLTKEEAEAKLKELNEEFLDNSLFF